jgi:hypothetical protein
LSSLIVATLLLHLLDKNVTNLSVFWKDAYGTLSVEQKYSFKKFDSPDCPHELVKSIPPKLKLFDEKPAAEPFEFNQINA